MNNTEFMERMYGILSTTGNDDESKLNALERLTAMANFEMTKLHTKHPKSNYDFSTLPGIDDICVKTIIPYLRNDVQALVNMFARTTKRFLTVVRVQLAYYRIVLTIKYGGIPGKELVHGCKKDTLTLKDANILVNTLKRSIHLQDQHGSVTYLSALHAKFDVTEFFILKGGSLIDKKNGILDGMIRACKIGRLNDVKLFLRKVTHHLDDGMTLREYVNKPSGVLIAAAENKHQHILDYLVDIAYADETELVKNYKKQFPLGTPIVCACEHGHFQDVKVFIMSCSGANNRQKYITRTGKDSSGNTCTPLRTVQIQGV